MRELSNWLEAYQEYTYETESAPIFNKWVGISTVASALRKKTWLQLGRLKVFPNLYIVLVADPGIARKSQAITYATDIMSDVPSIVTSADSVTPQALIQDIEDATCYENIPGIGPMRHASLSVISKEFETFLGNAGNSSKMLVTLTDLYDAGEKPWKHKTKNAGTTVIPSVFLNILGATTPQSLSTCLSELAIGGGLTSRILFVCSGQKTKKIPIPELTTRIVKLREDLTKDLLRISQILGAFEYTPDALEYWKNWYMNYDETSTKRFQPRWEFAGWYSRKPMLLQKISTILSATCSDDKYIKVEHIEKAVEYTEEIEKGMGNIFTSVSDEGKVSNNSNLVLNTIRQYKQISEKHLFQLLWREVKEDEFDIVMTALLKSKSCKRTFENPTTGKEEIWYHIIKED